MDSASEHGRDVHLLRIVGAAMNERLGYDAIEESLLMEAVCRHCGHAYADHSMDDAFCPDLREAWGTRSIRNWPKASFAISLGKLEEI